MKCKNCGQEVDGNFCPFCGTKVIETQSNPTASQKNTSKSLRSTLSNVITWVFGLLFFLVILAGVVGMFLGINIFEKDITNYDQYVRTGYLGEYTDYTVETLLDNAMEVSGYSVPGTWTSSSGTWSDKLKKVKTVTATYTSSDKSKEDAVIVFTLKKGSDDVFKLTDSQGLTLTDNDDIRCVLNEIYYITRLTEQGFHTDIAHFKDISIDMDFLRNNGSEFFKTYQQIYSDLNDIDSGEVFYGAPAAYSGDRSSLCYIFDEEPQGTSAASLLMDEGFFDKESLNTDPDTLDFYIGIADAFGIDDSDLIDNSDTSDTTDSDTAASSDNAQSEETYNEDNKESEQTSEDHVPDKSVTTQLALDEMHHFIVKGYREDECYIDRAEFEGYSAGITTYKLYVYSYDGTEMDYCVEVYGEELAKVIGYWDGGTLVKF